MKTLKTCFYRRTIFFDFYMCVTKHPNKIENKFCTYIQFVTLKKVLIYNLNSWYLVQSFFLCVNILYNFYVHMHQHVIPLFIKFRHWSRVNEAGGRSASKYNSKIRFQCVPDARLVQTCDIFYSIT